MSESPPKDKTLTIPHLPIARHHEFTMAFKDSHLNRAEFIEIMFNKAHNFDKLNVDKNNLIERIGKANEALVLENKREKAMHDEYQEKYDLLVQDLKDGVRREIILENIK